MIARPPRGDFSDDISFSHPNRAGQYVEAQQFNACHAWGGTIRISVQRSGTVVVVGGRGLIRRVPWSNVHPAETVTLAKAYILPQQRY
jgi:hypothetical protein